MDTASLPRNSPQEFLGVGFYSVGDAARLLRMPALSIRRWLTGYRFMRKGELHEVPPLWVPDLPKVDNTIELSFRDLIELRFVHQFTRAGVGLNGRAERIGERGRVEGVEPGGLGLR